MSLKFMTRAFDISVGSHLRKLVLIKLADNANDQGECWPSYSYIAKQCECSRSAVRAHIDALIDMGLIQKENRLGSNSGKGNCSNIYRLSFDNPVPPDGIPVPPDGTPCASRWHTPVPPAGTRTSHLEPVNESVIEPNCSGASANANAPVRSAKNKFDPLSVDLPEWLSVDLWTEWVEYRKALRKPIKTPQGAAGAVRNLDEYRQQGFSPEVVIRHSIANEYQGLYAPQKRPAGSQYVVDFSNLPPPDSEVPPGFIG